MKIFNKVSAVAVSAVALTFGLTGLTSAATKVPFGSADSYAILAGATITNTGSSVITGDLGLSPGTSVTGFPPATLAGTQQIANPAAVQAKVDLVTAYDNAAGQTPVTTIPTELGGTTLTPGTYASADGKFAITGTLTLDAQGNPNAVFIFKTASTLITISDSKIVLANSAQSCNIFWQVGSSATLGTNSTFKGSILAHESITLTTGANVRGSIFARTAAVTLDSNIITRAICASSSSTTVVEEGSTAVATATTTASSTDSDIKVKKTANKYSLKSGPAKVTFTYKVTNEGNVALSDVSLKDNKCDDTDFINGDDNDNDILDIEEEWKYRCKKTVKETETNTATAKGHANGKEEKDTDKVTVTVSTPSLPNAGIASENLWEMISRQLSSLF